MNANNKHPPDAEPPGRRCHCTRCLRARGVEPSYAEHLAEMGRCLDNGRLSVAQGLDDADLATAKAAIDFWRRGPALVFRACYEGWPRERIMVELY